MCNFAKQKASTWTDHDGLRRAFLRDTLDAIASRSSPSSKRVSTVYFGGGTPSLAPIGLLSDIIELLSAKAGLQPDSEMTMEGTPTSFTEQHLRDLKAIGVNRISLGIQSLHSESLALLNRDHTTRDSLEAVVRIRNVFNGPFDKLSVDLINGRPEQSVGDWKNELTTVLSLVSPEGFSAYQLTVEKGTPLARKVDSGRIVMPTPGDIEEFYFATVDAATAAGYKQIEVSTFVKEGETGCQHNIGYWEGRDFAGIGPGAHGRFVAEGKRYRTISIPDARAWVDQATGEKGHGIRKVVEVTPGQSRDEIVAMSLRTLAGLPESRLTSFVGRPLSFEQALDMQHVAKLCDTGFLDMAASPGERTLRLTAKGLAVSDIILPDILPVHN